ncbi:MAG: DUF4190 domain-containing protein [Micrococcales bacterium]|nr:DUF4190 domain-containing protein [Micrococcales bacterium]
MAVGIGALVTVCCWCLSPILGLVGLVLGIIAMNQIKSQGTDGRGMALAGIITSAVALVLQVGGLIVSLVYSWSPYYTP